MNTEKLTEPILTGREKELEGLCRLLDETMKGKGTVVFISGLAGSGKTRLSNEFLNLARSQGVTILSGWCLSNAAVPYLPFLGAFQSYISNNEENGGLSSQLMAKTNLLKEEHNRAISPQTWKDQTFASVTKELLIISTISPVILFIDDLHWADSASLSLLHYIARQIQSERILVVATFRSEEVCSNEHADRRYLIDTLRLMGRESLFQEIKLAGLYKDSVKKIAESMLGGSVDDDFAQTLALDSDGLPLFVVETIRMLYEQHHFSEINGKWQLASEKYDIPAKVKDIILRRIDGLKPGQRRILDAASVIGEKFDPKIIATTVGSDILIVLEALNDIAQSTFLVSFEDNYYRFDHAKSRSFCTK